MKISKDAFYKAGSGHGMSNSQLDKLWNELKQHEDEATPFTKYLFYFGAMIVISAMTWFMTLGWEAFGGWGIFFIALAYATGLIIAAKRFWNKPGLRIPAGLLATIAVCLVPLAIYGILNALDLWPVGDSSKYRNYYEYIGGHWVLMEVTTIIAGLVALRYFPFPFLTAPIFFSAWFLTMDIVPLLFGSDESMMLRGWAALILGLIMIAIGFTADHRKKRDYGFWSYLFGTLSFWGGLNFLISDKGEVAFFVYFVVNILMMCFAVLLRRNVLMVFGALGAFGYLGHLSYKIFGDSILFPFVLSILGLLVIYLGVLYQRNLAWINRNVFNKLPASVRNLLEEP